MGLDDVELIIAVEAAFQIKLADNLAAKLRTMADLLDLLWSELHRQHGDLSDAGITWNKEDVWRQLVEMTARQMGIDPASIKPESRLGP
jgi:hypothetical protein